jgi:hypothetical protein
MSSLPPPMPQAPPPGWWARNWKWSVPALAISGIACLAGFIFLIFAAVTGMMTSSEPYKHALSSAAADAQVRTALGTPVTDGYFSTGSFSTSGSSGSASLDIPISGPKGKGHIYLEAKKSAGVWTYPTLKVLIEGKSDPIILNP